MLLASPPISKMSATLAAPTSPISVFRPVVRLAGQMHDSCPSTSGREFACARAFAFRASFALPGRSTHVKARQVMAHANAEGQSAPVYLMPPVKDPKAEKEWLELQMREWLNEEWPAPTTVDVHAKLADATATAYIKARASGQNDLTDVLLALSTDLSTSFNFFDTFTDPFEVSNKASEVLMLRDGADVCCAHEADKARVGRVSEAFYAQRK